MEQVEDVARLRLIVVADLVRHKRVDLVGELGILLEVDDEEAVDPHGDQIARPLHHGPEARVTVLQTLISIPSTMNQVAARIWNEIAKTQPLATWWARRAFRQSESEITI